MIRRVLKAKCLQHSTAWGPVLTHLKALTTTTASPTAALFHLEPER